MSLRSERAPFSRTWARSGHVTENPFFNSGKQSEVRFITADVVRRVHSKGSLKGERLG